MVTADLEARSVAFDLDADRLEPVTRWVKPKVTPMRAFPGGGDLPRNFPTVFARLYRARALELGIIKGGNGGQK